jgi:hypothetical protein
MKQRVLTAAVCLLLDTLFCTTYIPYTHTCAPVHACTALLNNHTQGCERVDVPLHLEVSSVSPTAQQLVEAAGGSVKRVYYTRLGLRALLKVLPPLHACECSPPVLLPPLPLRSTTTTTPHRMRPVLLLPLPTTQPEAWEKRGRVLPRPVRAWPPRENGRYDCIGELPPARALPVPAIAAVAAQTMSQAGS